MKYQWSSEGPRVDRIGSGLFLLLALLGMAERAEAQSGYYHDFQQWFGLEARYDLNKHTSLGSQYVCRTYGFLQDFKGSYYYLQVRHQFSKHLYADGLIRVVDNNFGDLFRGEIGVQYRRNLGKNQLIYRLAYFNEREHLWPESEQPHAADHYLRNRIRYRRDLPDHFLAYASAEIYSHIHHGHVTLKRFALIAGVDRKFTDRVHGIVEYLFQTEYDTKAPVMLQSITLSLGYDFSRAKRYHRRSNSLHDD